MSLDLAVAVITQTMRIEACTAYINSISHESTVTVFTGDSGAFKGLRLPDGTSVRSLNSPDDLIPNAMQLRRVGRRRLVGWMRSGSKAGRFAEKLASRILGVLRQAHSRAGQESRFVAPYPINNYLVRELESLHRQNALSAIVVFDVFDLPTVLAFAEPTGVHVMVR